MKAITRIAAFIAIGISVVATAYGDVLNSSRQATARIIRADDIKELPTGSAVLPASSTGVLLSKDGYVFTSRDIMKQSDPRQDVQYLVLFPELNAEGENVSGVKAYYGVSTSDSTDNNMLVIKIAPNALPSPVTVYNNKVGNEKLGPEFVAVGFPLSSAEKTLTAQDKLNVVAALQEMWTEVSRNNGTGTTTKHANGFNSSLMRYMTPHKQEGQITSVAGQDGRQSVVSHSVKDWDSGAFGAPMLNRDKTSYLVAMFMENGKAFDAQSVISVANSKKVPIETWPTVTRKMPWLLMGASGCALVCIVIVYFILKRRHRGRKPLLRLRGEQGEQYILTSRDVCRGVLLGRSSKAKCRFTIPSVSGKHARLRLVNKRVVIEDVGSKGGTTVNGDPIAPGKLVKVHDGDVIKLAGYTVTVNSVR